MDKKESMTSRERVLKTLNYETPDRVPIDFGGFQTGIHKKAYESLIEYLGIKDDVNILDPVQQLAVPCEEVLQRFKVDTRYICAHGPDSFKGKIEQNVREGRLWYDLRDEFGIVWSMPDDQGLYMDITYHPLKDAAIKDVADYPFPKSDDPSRFTGVREHALQMRRETPYALCSCIGGVVYEICWYMRGLEQWFMDMIERPEFCEAVLDKILEYWIGFYSEFLSEVGDILDVIMIGDDLAGQNGPLFSPVFYREVVKPRQKKLVQYIKSLTNAKIWYHTCGSCYVYIDDLIDNGVDILNPVQIGLVNMEPKKLKEEFGDKIVFWGGGVESQKILPFGKPGEVKENVRQNLECFKPGGGYVFNAVHNVQAGVPPENIEAMFDAAYEYGFYS
ncbi:uroporphyrinogen-III decarboxylase [bacterium]|nr:uroporphyrinogen-III decarboxylase [bacterium]